VPSSDIVNYNTRFNASFFSYFFRSFGKDASWGGRPGERLRYPKPLKVRLFSVAYVVSGVGFDGCVGVRPRGCVSAGLEPASLYCRIVGRPVAKGGAAQLHFIDSAQHRILADESSTKARWSGLLFNLSSSALDSIKKRLRKRRNKSL
jgi:hypothetical protein